MTIRTLRVAPEAILDLLKAITRGNEIVIAGEPIPAEAALGNPRFDETSRTFEFDVVARFPERDSSPIAFEYAVRYGADLGAPRALAEPTP